jgi:short-subunit dehydrogenase
LIYAAVPAFVTRGRGTIVNIASIVGVAPELLHGVYGATKAFVLALSRSLRHELADTGVRVQVVLPGATATAFWNIAGTPVEHLPKEWVMSAEDMVDAALVGLDQEEFVISHAWFCSVRHTGRDADAACLAASSQSEVYSRETCHSSGLGV